MKKMLWIVNPHAGRGALSGKVIGCVNVFQQAGYDVTVYVTQGAQDATRIVRERALEFDRIVCAGGDGTLSEVVTGLMESPVRPPLGYIPGGRRRRGRRPAARAGHRPLQRPVFQLYRGVRRVHRGVLRHAPAV